tara:strand:+ start:277 stop:1158 length:882 start_codon:yes stop_codon:yes gene_type:complete
LNEGFEVVIGTSRKNASLPLELGKAKLVRIDLSNLDNLRTACNSVYGIVHLAGLDAKSSGRNPKQALSINSIGTRLLLQAAKDASVKKFVYVSTVHVYGSPLTGTLSEDRFTKPIHPYSISQRLAEDYVAEMAHEKSLHCTVYRLSNAVGAPVMKENNCWDLVTNDLSREVVEKNSMTIKANSATLRDFVPMSDVTAAIKHAISGGTISGEVYNLSSGKGLSLKKLTELIVPKAIHILKREPSVTFKNKLENIHSSYQLDIPNNKLKSTGYLATDNLEEEIELLMKRCQKWFV